MMHIVETIDNLLIDELAATESYHQILSKLKQDASLGYSEALLTIYEDHKSAVSSLQNQILELGGMPASETGAWGAWAKFVQGSANILGKQAAIKILQEGEKSGLEDYALALQDHELPADIRTLIELKLVPAQQSHIQVLDQLLDAKSD